MTREESENRLSRARRWWHRWRYNPSYDEGENVVIYRCTECGKVSVSLGWLHAHAEKHQAVGIGPLSIIPPWRLGDFDRLMDMTEVLRVEDVDKVPLAEVEVRA